MKPRYAIEEEVKIVVGEWRDITNVQKNMGDCDGWADFMINKNNMVRIVKVAKGFVLQAMKLA